MKTFANLNLHRPLTPLVMGIVNATPDSFSDGGEAFQVDDAVARGLQMVREGANLIDVGGESTRPGAAPVTLAQEISRTIPVIKRLVDGGVLVSIDTRHAEVMTAAVQAGAKIINDVCGLTNPDALSAAAATDASVVLMHMQGEPGTMQTAPHYENAPLEVLEFLKSRVLACEQAGIDRTRIAVDPGIGFGKTLAHNLEILKALNIYDDLGLPVLLGVSRKSFIGAISDVKNAQNRLPGSLAAALWGAAHGASILRVHDVAETVQALAVWRAIESS